MKQTETLIAFAETLTVQVVFEMFLIKTFIGSELMAWQRRNTVQRIADTEQFYEAPFVRHQIVIGEY